MENTKQEVVNKNIFEKAISLSENKMTELEPTNKYNECDSLFINHQNKTFWFTTKITAIHTLKLAQLN